MKTKNPKLKQIRRGHRRFMAGEKGVGAEFVRAALLSKGAEDKTKKEPT